MLRNALEAARQAQRRKLIASLPPAPVVPGGSTVVTTAPQLIRPGGQVLTRRAPAPVSPGGSMVVTTAQAAPLQPFTAPPPIITTTSAPIRPVNGVLTKSEPMSLALRNSQMGGTTGPGLGTAVKTVVGAAIGAGVNWAVNQIGSGRSSGGGGAPPSIPVPTVPGPGGAQMGQMGMGGAVGRIGGAVGTIVGRIAGSKKVRAVVGGVAGWWLVDKATGALLGPTTAPSRRMNVLNLRALRRADRRVDGFVKVARKALSSTGFKVERRGKSCAPKKRRCK